LGRVIVQTIYDLSDANLSVWSTRFGHITATPTAFHVTVSRRARYQTLSSAFDLALVTWRNQSTKTPVASTTEAGPRKLLAMASICQ